MGRLKALLSRPRQPDATRDATTRQAPSHVATVRECDTRQRDQADESRDAFADPAAEARRQSVLAMLRKRLGIRYAGLTDTDADPEAVLFTLAIRGQATCELRIPKTEYDPFLLLDLIERHRGTIH